MNSSPRFSRAEAAHRLGPAAIAIARRNVDTAPPIRPETKEQIRAVFLSACASRGPLVAPAA